jgi:alkylation response protein AidB-like acyl-CoA dehydrogenase
MRTQLRRIVSLAQGGEGVRGVWSDPALRREVGHLDAEVESLWRLTQMCCSEAERTGMPALVGSAVKLRYSELYQQVGELGLRVLGPAALSKNDFADLPIEEMQHDYLWALQFTISGGTSQVQRNIIAERILGLPREKR